MKTVFMGSDRFGIDSLDALSSSRHSLELVVTQPGRPAGRHRKPRPTPVAVWAMKKGVRLVEAHDVNDPTVVAEIARTAPEVIVVAAFGQKIGTEIINLPRRGIINVHASLLPKYRGAAPINWAIINGETRTGISIITVAEKMDAGDIIAQAEVDIAPDDTAETLGAKLARLAGPLLLETLDKIADGTATYTKQDHTKATLAPRLKKSDGFLDFSAPANHLERRIRGLWPWPAAAALYVRIESRRPERVTIASAEVVPCENPAALAAGTLDEHLNVICGKDSLKIRKIKPAGRNLMDFTAFVRGRATKPGDAFTSISDATD